MGNAPGECRPPLHNQLCQAGSGAQYTSVCKAWKQPGTRTPFTPFSEQLSSQAGKALNRNFQGAWQAQRSSATSEYGHTHAYPLVILLLLDLFHLIKQLAGSELELCQLVPGSDLGVVVGVLPNLDVQVHTLQRHGVEPRSPKVGNPRIFR